ncbi:hypothetical protein TNCV_4232611 [Trichonephila clavipes]|nr:hypothetical protein TNCV_4232611 [Trichonephila clavipes]
MATTTSEYLSPDAASVRGVQCMCKLRERVTRTACHACSNSRNRSVQSKFSRKRLPMVIGHSQEALEKYEDKQLKSVHEKELQHYGPQKLVYMLLCCSTVMCDNQSDPFIKDSISYHYS